MVQMKAINESAIVTVASVASALASVFFVNWVNKFDFWISGILILFYSLFIFVVLYFFFKK